MTIAFPIQCQSRFDGRPPLHMALLKGCFSAGEIAVFATSPVACPAVTKTGKRLVKVAYRPLSMLILLVSTFCQFSVLAVRTMLVWAHADGVPAPAFEVVTAPSAWAPVRLYGRHGTALARLVLSGIRLARPLGLRPLRPYGVLPVVCGDSGADTHVYPLFMAPRIGTFGPHVPDKPLEVLPLWQDVLVRVVSFRVTLCPLKALGGTRIVAVGLYPRTRP